jgi:hypothetical protein
MNKLGNSKKQGKKNVNNIKKQKGKIVKEKNHNLIQNEEEEFQMYQNNDYDINNFPNIDSEYRKQLDERMDLLMEKIDQNINNTNNYNQLNMIIHNSKINYINNYKPNNNNNNYYQIDKSLEKNYIHPNDNDIGEIIEEKSEEEVSQKLESKKETISSKNQIIKDKENDNLKNKLLKRNKFLENEINYLKYKLNSIQNQKNFIQKVIMNDNNMKRYLFDIFTVNYFKQIALNWKEVSDFLIDELIIDEIHELTKIKLKSRKNERTEEEKEKKLNGNNLQLSPVEFEELILFNNSLKGIKETIKSVKESEKNLCKKYKIKIKD